MKTTRRAVLAGGLAASPALAFAQPRRVGEGPGRGPWRTGRPEDFGLSTAKLDAMAERLRPFQGRQGVVVVRDGVIVYENYWANDFHSASPNWRNVSFSSAKSWGSAMVGVAVRQGRLKVTDVIDRYHGPDHFGFRPGTTVEHLLTMSSGGTRWRKPSSRRPAQMTAMVVPQRGGDYVLEPADEGARTDGSRADLGYAETLKPGEAFWYSGADCDHLSDVIAGATGRSSYAFETDFLFRPIGAEHLDYQPEGIDPRGNVRIGGSMELCVRDLARLGQLWLNRGRWDGYQLVNAAYVDQAVTPSKRNPDYGYLWWLNTSGRMQAPRNMAYAYGAFGQMSYVLRDQRIVVTTMGYEPGPNLFDSDARLWALIGPGVL